MQQAVSGGHAGWRLLQVAQGREQERWLSQKPLDFVVAVKVRGRFGARDRQAGRSEGRWQGRREKRRENERGEREGEEENALAQPPS